MANLAELQQERVRLFDEQKQMAERAASAGRALLGDEQAAYNTRSARIDEIDSIAQMQRDLERQAGITVADPTGRRSAPNASTRTGDAVDQNAALRSWLRGARSEAGDASIRSAGFDPHATVLDLSLGNGLRANQSSSNGELGGYTISSALYGGLVEAKKTYGSVRSLAFEFSLDHTGNVLIPTASDVDNEGEIVAENAAPSNQNNVSFGQVSLPLYTFTTGQPFRIPLQLIEDSAFDIVAYVNKVSWDRILKVENRYLTTGNGTSQPLGCVSGATVYSQLANGAANVAVSAITTDMLIGLQDSLESAYDGNARFMFPKAVLSHLRTLKRADSNTYIYTMGDIRIGTPDTLLGKSYSINQHMASSGVNAVPVLYGDFANYWVRNGMSLRIQRMSERYIEYGQIGFIGHYRSGGTLVNAGTAPIVSLKLAAASS